MKSGDLVRYVERPRATLPKVVPRGKQPLGLVIFVEEKLLEHNSEPGTILITVLVKWANPKWNGKNGVSEECRTDLEILQKL
jgi:hypothetical protein